VAGGFIGLPAGGEVLRGGCHPDAEGRGNLQPFTLSHFSNFSYFVFVNRLFVIFPLCHPDLIVPLSFPRRRGSINI
jgi:hypothetical protein